MACPPSARRALHLLLCLSLTAGFGSAWADEINEFDEGSDGWTMYPATMGRSSEAGWVNVTNDGEGSIRNSPTGTRYTYYWKLTRDIDLTELTDPSLELKYHFKGHSYDYFRVQVGEEGAVGNPRRCRACDHLREDLFPLDDVGQPLGDGPPRVRVEEEHPIVVVDGHSVSGGPPEGLVGIELDGPDP